MKWTFLLFAFTFFASINAQNWSPVGANWKYSCYGFFPGYVDVSYTGDTVIDGQAAKILSKTFHGMDWSMSIVSSAIGSDYTYENNGTVFIRYQNQWDTLYDFNAQVGENWRMAKQPITNVCPLNSRLKVIATGNTTIHNELRKYLVVDFCNPDLSTLGIQDTIVENIGFLDSYFLPYDQFDGWVDGNEGGPLRCYTDNNFPTYAPHFTEACDFIMGLEEIDLNSRLLIYPNPVIDEIHLTLGGVEKFVQYAIYSLDGKLHDSGPLKTPISIHHLDQGNYLLEVSNSTQKQYAKIVKTH